MQVVGGGYEGGSHRPRALRANCHAPCRYSYHWGTKQCPADLRNDDTRYKILSSIGRNPCRYSYHWGTKQCQADLRNDDTRYKVLSSLGRNPCRYSYHWETKQCPADLRNDDRRYKILSSIGRTETPVRRGVGRARGDDSPPRGTGSIPGQVMWNLWW
jgi:hypothetical protein